VRAVRRAGAVGDGAVELPAVGGPAGGLAEGEDDGGRAEGAVGAEDLVLRLLGEPGADLQRVVGHEAHAPAGGHVAAGHLDPDLRVRRDVGLDAAVAARHEQAVEARVLDGAVQVLRRASQHLGLGGALLEEGTQLAGTAQELVGGDLGWGDGHRRTHL